MIGGPVQRLSMRKRSTQVLVWRNQTNRKTDTKITLPYRRVSHIKQKPHKSMGIASRHDRVKPTVSHKRIKSLWPKIKGGEKLSNCKNQQHGCEKLLCYRSHPRVLSDVLCLSSKKLSSFKGSGYCFKKRKKTLLVVPWLWVMLGPDMTLLW